MAGCLDNVNLECGCMGDGAARRNIIASISAGTIFSVGWWIIIDAAAMYTDTKVLVLSIGRWCIHFMRNYAITIVSLFAGIQSRVPHVRRYRDRGIVHDKCRFERGGQR